MFAEVVNALTKARKVLVLSHVNPDPDAYGSSLSLYLALKKLNKQVDCVNESSLVEDFNFFPKISSISQDVGSDYDVIVYCDCATEKRIGDKLVDKINSDIYSINIDHHISNTNYADVNIVVPNSSSTCEVMASLIEAMGVSIDLDIATCLFAGIVGDTNSFKYATTSENTFKIASKLIAAGVKPEEIANQMYSNIPLNRLRLQANAVLNTEFLEDNKIAGIWITKEDLRKFSADNTDTEGLVEKARDVQGVHLSFLAREDDGFWKVSLRSKHSNLNVSDVAQSFGGGGHSQAAAFRYRQSQELLKKELLEKLRSIL